MTVNGIDIIEISRIAKAIDSWGDRFLKRIYSDRELEYCKGQVPKLAARFAGKEAVMKALGTGHIGIYATDIEILPDSAGVPVVNIKGRSLQKAAEVGLQDLCISLSHSRDYAIASVIGKK